MPNPVLTNPHYVQLVTHRRKISVALSLVMLVSYLAFILLIAFKPAVLGIHIAGPITLGIPIGLGLIILAMVLTGVYVRLSNNVFDPLVEEAREALRKSLK